MRLILAVVAAHGVWLLLSGRRLVSIPRPPAWWLASVAIGGFLGLVADLPASVATTVGLAPIALAGIRHRFTRARLRRETSTRWPDFLAQVRGRIGAGEPLPDAVRVAGRSIGGEFSAFDRAWGGSFVEGLEELRARWADPLADRVLTTLRVAAITGGAHVDDVVSSLAASLAEEVRLRRAHEAAVAQQQMTAGVALVSPWLILALSLATNPQASAEFATKTGHVVLVTGAAATVLGYVLARRAARLSRPPRVFG